MKTSKTLSIIVPTWNEEGNIGILVKEISKAMKASSIKYEIVFIDDNSTDNTRKLIKSLETSFPIRLFKKKGKRGKAFSLIQGFKEAKYDLIAMIDADLQYSPDAIPEMVEKIKNGADIVVANRIKHQEGFLRSLSSNVFKSVFVKGLHRLNIDSQSGLKVFKKEVAERIKVNPLPWSFDLEFLTKARSAGYIIDSVNIVFKERHSGKTKIGIIGASAQLAYAALKVKLQRSQVIPFLKSESDKIGEGFTYKGNKFIHHTSLKTEESAFRRFSLAQIIAILLMISLLILGILLNWHATIVLFIAILTVLYFVDLLFNLFLIARSFAKTPEIQVSEAEIARINENDWPAYTILCPLYKEWEVIPQFVTAMSRLDYPKNKLQVMLLLEENDPESIEHAKAMNLPEYFEIVIVPHSLPKTKPKACNYGLKKATGEYIVIYDAEDVPDPLQLKKAYIAFQKLHTNVACIQAKLNFYNPHQNVLTRVFTAEYSLWFDLVLTGLQSIGAPIPLGGTSNHFKTEILRDLKGWDSFNVTEDCDLGMRIAKRGLKTAVVDSMTLEEANSEVKNWFSQRTRWIKGYIQTYFVHMRRPKDFINHWREPHVITFQLVVGGKILSMFINPVMWTITLTYFLARPIFGSFIESFFPIPILYMAAFSLIIGNFLYMYYYMIGCAKREYYDIIKYAFLVPFYWLAMSAAAWVAFREFLVKPHHWAKTKHGLHLNNAKAVKQSEEKIGTNLVDKSLA